MSEKFDEMSKHMARKHSRRGVFLQQIAGRVAERAHGRADPGEATDE